MFTGDFPVEDHDVASLVVERADTSAFNESQHDARSLRRRVCFVPMRDHHASACRAYQPTRQGRSTITLQATNETTPTCPEASGGVRAATSRHYASRHYRWVSSATREKQLVIDCHTFRGRRLHGRILRRASCCEHHGLLGNAAPSDRSGRRLDGLGIGIERLTCAMRGGPRALPPSQRALSPPARRSR